MPQGGEVEDLDTAYANTTRDNVIEDPVIEKECHYSKSNCHNRAYQITAPDQFEERSSKTFEKVERLIEAEETEENRDDYS